MRMLLLGVIFLAGCAEALPEPKPVEVRVEDGGLENLLNELHHLRCEKAGLAEREKALVKQINGVISQAKARVEMEDPMFVDDLIPVKR